MTLLKDISDCSTYSVRGLDNQLIWQMNQLSPSCLAKIDNLNVELGQAVHPWLQPAAKKCLASAIAERGTRMIINSAYRTLAGQALLRKHYENGCCGITAAARPGQSNHNNASAIDVEDADGWKTFLENHGWQKLGDFDPMHYDCIDGIADTHSLAVTAFQTLWNHANPNDQIPVDGDFGPNTNDKLLFSPAEGFPGLPVPRILMLTDPAQQGKDVGKLQLALRSKGITVVANEMFGSGTDQAVREFQSANKLIVDGVVGMATAIALGL